MISKHISYKEGVYSNTATRRGIDNTPNNEQLDNMELIAEKVFEPLREWVGGPIKINSFFRSPDLNKAIGGSVSYVSEEDNRNRCLKAYKENGKTKYIVI